MPQMSPLMWSNLFIMFSLLLLMSMIKIYFMSKPEIHSTTTLATHPLINPPVWMW